MIVLTTSKAEETPTAPTIRREFLITAREFEQLVAVMKALGKYWFEIVELPSNK